MKIKGLQEVLTKAIATVSKAIAAHNTLPILENISMSAAGSILTLIATDLEISVHTTVEVEVLEEGAITIPAKLLVQYMTLIPQGTMVEFSVGENLTLELSTPFSKTKMRGMAAEEYPLIPAFSPETTVMFDKQEFLRSLGKVVFSTSNNMSRPILAGVLMKKIGNTTSFVSTDGFRLSEQTLMNASDSEDFSSIVPAKTLYEVLRIFSRDGDEQVTMSFAKNQVQFALKDVQIVSRLIEGEFPDYAQIIPKEVKTRISIPVESLLLALKRVNLFARANDSRVMFEILPESQTLRLYTDTLEIGEDSASIDADEATGESMIIALNAQFVLDVLGNIRTSHVALLAVAPLSAFVLREVSDKKEQDDYLHLIMPLRITA